MSNSLPKINCFSVMPASSTSFLFTEVPRKNVIYWIPGEQILKMKSYSWYGRWHDFVWFKLTLLKAISNENKDWSQEKKTLLAIGTSMIIIDRNGIVLVVFEPSPQASINK